jgi:hypothetical protein
MTCATIEEAKSSYAEYRNSFVGQGDILWYQNKGKSWQDRRTWREKNVSVLRETRRESRL